MENFFDSLPLSYKAVSIALSALVLSLILGKFVLGVLFSLKIGQPIRYANFPTLFKLHENKKNTPTMGGVTFIIIFFILGSIFFDWKLSTGYLFMLAIGLLALLGALDDLRKLKGIPGKGISSKFKFGSQGLIGLLVLGFSYLYSQDEFFALFSRFDPSFFGVLASLIFFLFVFCGSSNAVNLTDGLDGLASGVTAIVSLGLICVILMNSTKDIYDYNQLIALSIILGASVGFLWFNQFPAQVFMGDTGSLSLGGLLGLIAFSMKKEWIYAVMGIIFVVEAMSVILQVLSFRFRNQKRIFLCSPLHHHYQYLGMNEVKIVTRFWIVTILSTMVGVILARFL